MDKDNGEEPEAMWPKLINKYHKLRDRASSAGSKDCYGAAPTQGQRSLVNDQRGLGTKETGGEGSSPQRLNRRLE